jgi:hypothetical protein
MEWSSVLAAALLNPRRSFPGPHGGVRVAHAKINQVKLFET